MKNIISKRLKDLRKVNGLSQKEIAEGICTQAVISNIEKGDVIPSSIILYKIAEKLNVDINYFFSESLNVSFNQMEEVKNHIRNLVRKKDYESISYIVKNELEKNCNLSNEDYQFLKWHEGICEYHVKLNAIKALDILFKIVNFSEEKEILSEQEIGILNSIAVIYFEIKKYEQSLEIFNKCLKNENIKDTMTEIRVLYGISRTLTALDQIENSIFYSKQAIQICIKKDTLYLLGELHFLIARNLVIIDKKEESKIYLDYAKMVFKLQNKQNYLNIIDKLISEIKY